MRQIPLNSILLWMPELTDQFELQGAAQCNVLTLASAAATGQVCGVCAVVTSESYEARRVSSAKPSQASVAPGLIGRLPQCTCNEGDRHECDRHECDRHEGDVHECDRHDRDRHERDRHEGDLHQGDKHEA